jgi:hypothetical protein
MKLFLTATSERGKPVTKSGNDEINITLTTERRQKFDIKFTGEEIEVMSYFDSSVEVINYDPYKQEEEKCPSCNKIPDIFGRCKCCNKDSGR